MSIVLIIILERKKREEKKDKEKSLRFVEMRCTAWESNLSGITFAGLMPISQVNEFRFIHLQETSNIWSRELFIKCLYSCHIWVNSWDKWIGKELLTYICILQMNGRKRETETETEADRRERETERPMWRMGHVISPHNVVLSCTRKPWLFF